MTVAEVAGSVWFRAIAPVVVLIVFELLVRYLAKSDNQRFRTDDYFLAIPLLGAAITALPGLIAVRAGHHPSEAEVATGASALVILVLTACWLVAFDRRTLRKHRRRGSRWKRFFWTTAVPDLLAAICLGMVFAYAP